MQVVFEGLDPESKCWTMSAARRIGGHIHNPSPDQVALRIMLDHSLIEVRPCTIAQLRCCIRCDNAHMHLHIAGVRNVSQSETGTVSHMIEKLTKYVLHFGCPP